MADRYVRPQGALPTIILVKSGDGNHLTNNNITANREYRMVLDASTTGTKVLWSAPSGKLQAYSSSVAFIPTP